MAIEEEIDQQVLLEALLQRSFKQIELLNKQSNQIAATEEHTGADESSGADLFDSQTFTEIDESGKVVGNRKGTNLEDLDGDLSHSITVPATENRGNLEKEVPDRLD